MTWSAVSAYGIAGRHTYVSLCSHRPPTVCVGPSFTWARTRNEEHGQGLCAYVMRTNCSFSLLRQFSLRCTHARFSIVSFASAASRELNLRIDWTTLGPKILSQPVSQNHILRSGGASRAKSEGRGAEG